MQLHIPEQTVTLEGDEYLIGDMTIAGQGYRLEAYPTHNQEPFVEEMIDDLYRLAECGGPLATHTIDGREFYLVVVPRGGTS